MDTTTPQDEAPTDAELLRLCEFILDARNWGWPDACIVARALKARLAGLTSQPTWRPTREQIARTLYDHRNDGAECIPAVAMPLWEGLRDWERRGYLMNADAILALPPLPSEER